MNIAQLILEIIIILGLLYLAFFKSYFQERGKIVATKKDIEEITTKVESVKNEFEVLTHSRISLETEKRNSFLNYFDRYFVWLNTLLNTSFGNIDLYKNEEIEKYLTNINNIYLDLCVSEDRMKLWNDDEDLNKLAGTLKLETIKDLSALCITTLKKLKPLNDRLKDANLIHKDYQPPVDEIYDEHKIIILEHLKTVTENFRNLKTPIDQFMKQSRKYLLENIKTYSNVG